MPAAAATAEAAAENGLALLAGHCGSGKAFVLMAEMIPLLKPLCYDGNQGLIDMVLLLLQPQSKIRTKVFTIVCLSQLLDSKDARE